MSTFMKDNKELNNMPDSNLKNKALSCAGIDALCADYSNIYRVDCKTRNIEFLRLSGNTDGLMENLNQSEDPYRALMEDYIHSNVFPEDRNKLMFSIDFDNVYQRLKKHKQFHVRFRILCGSRMHYYLLKFCRGEDKDDFEHVILGFANEDNDVGQDKEIERLSTGTAGGRRKVLIVEDVELNREMLKAILEDEYDVLLAENGEVGLKLLSENYRDLSVVLLDMYMPVCSGFQFLETRRGDALLSTVPVIVTTGSENSDDEVRCLELGASDFITKPYNPRVVISRIRSIIKLHESDVTLAAVEYDDTTGLYTRPAFCHYAENMIKSSDDAVFDMIIAEIENLSQIEVDGGERTGDALLAYFGKQFAKNIDGAIGFRKDNQFIFILKHKLEKDDYLKRAEEIEAAAPLSNINVKYGFYFDIDKTASITELCERLRLTVGSISGSFITNNAVYDEKIAKRQSDKYRMEAEFEGAIENEEFVIYLQPKCDVRSERITGAEALVRWKKPDGSMVSPGAFIPLFEEDGLIRRLDEYIFRKVCMLQKERLDKGMPAVRISINLSRATLIGDGVAEMYADIVKEIGIPYDMISIELTESFALENNRMQELAENLVAVGFRLDMDDFGSGYSSMASLITLPFRIVKFDKSLIDRIGDKKGEILIEYAIAIAHKLDMRVVAEGVEQAEQAAFLRSMNCDMIQGFYYSPPVPYEKFDELILG